MTSEVCKTFANFRKFLGNMLRLFYRSSKFFRMKKLNRLTVIQKQKVFILELRYH